MRSVETLALQILNAEGEFPRSATDQEQRLATAIAADETLPGDLRTPGINSMLYRTYRDIRESGLSISMLAKRASSIGGLIDRVVPVFRELESLLTSKGAWDPSDLLTRAALRIATGSRVAPQILFGFYDVTGVQERLLNAMSDAGLLCGVYLPVPLQEGQVPSAYQFSAPFVSRTLSQTSGSVAARTSALPSWSIRGHFDVQEELGEACRQVRSLLDAGTLPRQIAITARSLANSDLILLQRAAREFGFELRNGPGRSIASHRFGRTVLQLLQLRDNDFPRKSVVEILRCGLTGGSRRSDYDINAIDRAARDCGIAGGSSAAVRGVIPHLDERAQKKSGNLEAYAEAVAELESMTAGVRPSATGEIWASLIERWTARFDPSSEEDLGAIELLSGQTSLLRSLAGERPLKLQQAADLIASAPPLSSLETDGVHVWAGDVMKFRGRIVDHLIVIRMQDDVFPQRRIEDPLLRDRERKSLGVRAIGDGRDEEAFLFQLLLDSARSTIRFSYAMSDATGKTLRPSQLLSNFRRRPGIEACELAPSPATLSQLEQRVERASDDPSPRLKRRTRLLEHRGSQSEFDGFVEPDEELHAFIRELLNKISPTRLEPIGECPQKFLMGTVFAIRELEDPGAESESNPRVKGSLDHQVLEEFYREMNPMEIARHSTAGKLDPRVKDRLLSIIHRVFDAHALASPAVNRNILAMELAAAEARLERWVAWDLGELSESGFRPQNFERRFGEDEEQRLDIGPVSLAIHGSIDRIDVNPDTRDHRLIDYKSGFAKAQQNLGDKVDVGHRLQLPLYALVLEKLSALSPEQIEAIIRPLGDPTLDPGKYSFNLGEKREAILQNLTTLFEGVLAGRFPAMPSDEACHFCVVGLWCRTRHDPDESRALRPYQSAVHLLGTLKG